MSLVPRLDALGDAVVQALLLTSVGGGGGAHEYGEGADGEKFPHLDDPPSRGGVHHLPRKVLGVYRGRSHEGMKRWGKFSVLKPHRFMYENPLISGTEAYEFAEAFSVLV